MFLKNQSWDFLAQGQSIADFSMFERYGNDTLQSKILVSNVCVEMDMLLAFLAFPFPISCTKILFS